MSGRSKSAKKQVHVRIRTIDGSGKDIVVDRKCTGKAIWDAFSAQFKIKEEDFFGLQYEVVAGKGVKQKSQGGSYSLGKPTQQWLSLTDTAEMQLGTPSVKNASDGVARWELEFRVRFYVSKILVDQWSEYSRFLFYLQLRDDVFSNRIPMEDEQIIFMAGLASQIHFGNWEKDKVPLENYLGQIDAIQLRRAEFGAKVEVLHAKHSDMLSHMAQAHYMDLVAENPMYGIEWYSCYNDTGVACKLGLSPIGVTVRMKTLEQLILPWHSIKNIAHSKKKFLFIRRSEFSADISNVYMFDSKAECKTMWIAALQQHTFYRRSEFDKKVQIKNAAVAAPKALLPPKPQQHSPPKTIKTKGSIRRYTEEPAANISVRSPNYQKHLESDASFKVTLTVHEDDQLGFSVSGGSDAEPHGLPIFVDQILVDGVAHRDGRIGVGDHVVSIGDVSLVDISHAKAVSYIEQAVQDQTELVFRMYRPQHHHPHHQQQQQAYQKSCDVEPVSCPPHPVPAARTNLPRDVNHNNHDMRNPPPVQHQPLQEPHHQQPQQRNSILSTTPDQTPNRSLLDHGGASFTLVGGADSGCGLFISSVTLPDQDIQEGDELLGINGISTEGMTVNEALEIIYEADARDDLQLEVAENEQGFAMVAEELRDPRRTPQRSHTSQQVGVLTPMNTVTSQRRPSGSSSTMQQALRAMTKVGGKQQIVVEGMPPTPFYARTTFDFDAKAFENGIPFRSTDVVEILEIVDETVWIGHHTGTGKIGEIPSIEFSKRYMNKDQTEGSTANKPYEIVHKQRIDSLLGNPKGSRPVAIYGDTDGLMEHMQPMSDTYGLDIFHAPFHTTRAPKDGEVDGVDYHFISEDDMKYGISHKLFLEAGTYNNHYYGLSFASVVNASRQGKTTVMHTARIKAIGRLLNATGLRPVALFIEPSGDMSEEQRQFRETYGQSFTHIIKANGSRASTAAKVLELIQRSVRKPYWLRRGHPLSKTEPECPPSLAFRTDCCLDTVTTLPTTSNSNSTDAATPQAVLSQPQQLPQPQLRPHSQRRESEELENDGAEEGQQEGEAVREQDVEREDEVEHDGEDVDTDEDGDQRMPQPAPRKWVAPITTRPRRDSEVDGKQYHFLSRKRFESMIGRDELIEWGMFHDEYYGVARPTANQKPKPLLRSRTLATALMSSKNESTTNIAGIENLTSSSDVSVTHALSQHSPVHTQEIARQLDTRRHSEGNPGVTPAFPQWLEESMVARSQTQDELDQDHDQDEHFQDQELDQDQDQDQDQDDERANPQSPHQSPTCTPDRRTGDDVSARPSTVDSHIVELDPQSLLNEITLVRNSSGSFGFTITGGVDFGDLPSISRVHNISIVEATVRNLCAGDYILAINGVCLAKATHDDTINLLRESAEVLSLVLAPGNVTQHNLETTIGSPIKLSSTYLLGARLVRTRMSAGMGFGIEIEPTQDGRGARVLSVVRGSVAEREYIAAGMCLLTFNGEDISGLKTEQIKSLFAKERGDITLIARGTIINSNRREKEAKSPSTVLDSSELDQPDMQLRKLVLQKGQKGFGFRLGVDTSGVTRVLKVNEGSPAEGLIWVDDLIYSINGLSAVGRRRKEALNQLLVNEEVCLEILSLNADDENNTPRVDLDDSAFLDIHLEIDDDGLGIDIAALPDSGIYVQRVIAGGSADRDGRIFEGDVILEVNGIAVYDKSHPTEFFAKCFQEQRTMRMKLMRGDSLTRTVTITRTTNQSLGMKIVLSDIVTVASVVPDGLACEFGIKAGNQLLMVNNVSLHDKNFKEIRALLSTTPNLILEVAAGN